MSYNPLTDFLGLLRNAQDGVEFERMPGTDYVVAAMARMGLFKLYVGQTPPLANQATTVWLKPSQPSWVAEGVVFLWNPITQTYVQATPALWDLLLSPSGYFFQSVSNSSNAIAAGVSILAVQRNAPASTALLLPNMATQFISGRALKIVDWSTAVTNHVVTLTTPDGATIMQQASWQLLSNAAQLSGVTLTPCPDLNGWIIAP